MGAEGAGTWSVWYYSESHNPDDTVNLIRLGLWQNKLLRMIASHEKAREKYHQHLAAYPDNKYIGESFKQNLLVMEKAFASFEETINCIDETLALPNDRNMRCRTKRDSKFFTPRH